MSAQVRERRGGWARAHYVTTAARCQATASEEIDDQGFTAYTLTRGDGSGVRVVEGNSGTIRVYALRTDDELVSFGPRLSLAVAALLLGQLVG